MHNGVAQKRLRSRYATCKHCSEEFDVTDNTELECIWHDGKRAHEYTMLSGLIFSQERGKSTTKARLGGIGRRIVMGASPTKRICILKDSYGRVVIRLVIPRVAKLGLIWRRKSRINARDTKSSACCQFRKTSASELCQKHSSLLGIRPCLPKLLTHQVILLANFHVRELEIALRLEHDHEIRASKLEVRDLFPPSATLSQF